MNDKEESKNYYAGLGLVFGVIVAVNISIIFDLPYWIIGIGAGLGLVVGSAYDSKQKS